MYAQNHFGALLVFPQHLDPLKHLPHRHLCTTVLNFTPLVASVTRADILVSPPQLKTQATELTMRHLFLSRQIPQIFGALSSKKTTSIVDTIRCNQIIQLHVLKDLLRECI